MPTSMTLVPVERMPSVSARAKSGELGRMSRPTTIASSRATRCSAGSFCRLRLRNCPVAWQTYEALLRELDGRHVFMTYDRGTLELMSPLASHDRAGHLLSRLVETYTEVMDIPIAGFGTTTWRRKELDRGLEADQCFYVLN